MNVAKEKAVRETVRNALLKLADGNTHTRMDLFGTGTPADVERSYRILKILGERGLIQSARLETTGPALHEAKKAAELRAIAESEIELTRLIWPSKAPTPAKIQFTEEWCVAAAKNEGNSSIEAGAPDDVPMKTQIEAILRLVAALAENVIYVRGKIDELNSVACSHCSAPEKHR